MRLWIVGEIDWESGVDLALRDPCFAKLRDRIEQQDYGTGLTGISVNIVCVDRAWKIRRRVRLESRQDNLAPQGKAMILALDIMLNMDAMKAATRTERIETVGRRLADDVSDVLNHYRNRIHNFDLARFVADLRSWASEYTPKQ